MLQYRSYSYFHKVPPEFIVVLTIYRVCFVLSIRKLILFTYDLANRLVRPHFPAGKADQDSIIFADLDHNAYSSIDFYNVSYFHATSHKSSV